MMKNLRNERGDRFSKLERKTLKRKWQLLLLRNCGSQK